MGVTVATTRVACNTATGDQTITTADLGSLTPKAAMFIVGAGVTDGTAAANAVLSVGATDGTNQRVSSVFSDDNVATSDVRYRGTTDEVVMIIDNAGNIVGEANFKNFTTNGVVITWGDAVPSAYLLTVIFFAGTDLSVHVNEFTSSNSADGEVDVTDPGFEPDQVIVFAHRGAFNDSSAQALQGTIGFCDNGVSVVQGSINVGELNGQAGCTMFAISRNDRVCQNINMGGASLYGDVELASFDASGFSSFTRRIASNTVAYLALAYGGAAEHWVGTITSPTSTGDDAQTGPGFTPQFVMLAPSFIATDDTLEQDGDAGSYGLAVFDADDEYCTSIACEDGAGTMNTQSLSDDTAVNLPVDDGSAGFTASFVSFDANGWTINFSATNGTARQWVALAIGEEVVGDLSVSVSDTVSIAESVDVLLPWLLEEAAEAVSLTDAPSLLLPELFNLVADAIAIADAANIVVGTVDLSLSVADAVSASDTATLSLPELHLTISDAVGITDTASMAMAALSLSVADAIVIVDGPRYYSDLIVVLDHATVIVASPDLPVSVADAVGLADTTAETLPWLLTSRADAVAVADVLAILLPELNVTVADGLTVADMVALLLPELHVQVSDAVTVAEALALLVAELYLSVADAVTVAEAVALLLPELFCAVADAISVTEAVTVQAEIEGVLQVNVADAVSVTDSATLTLPALFLARAEAVSITDTDAVLLPVLLTDRADAVSIGTAATVEVVAVAGLLVQAADAVAVADTTALLLPELPVSRTDSLAVSDSALALLPELQLTRTDAIAIDDSVALSGLLVALVVLTLRARSFGLTFTDRSFDLTLKER
jgi:hypothetical protein